MDKKSKFPQSSSKGTSSDSKKNQDVVGSRPYPKSSRKREPTGASNFSKYDQPRKAFAQKGKNFDKRPKPKGYYYGSAKEDSKVVDKVAEPGSVMNQGSKKQSLNHLLNFYYPPRDMRNGSETWTGRSLNYDRNSNRWLPPIQRHKYNKEQFLQANCQFIVSDNGDYNKYLADPDMLVDWKLIEKIRVHTSDKLSCPICLSSPVAAKMTRCGHVYCWACILHYLSLSDKTWRKCPICYESIYRCDLKSVVEVTQASMNIGDKVQLRLMRREKGSLITTAVPEKETLAPTDFFYVTDDSHCQVYSKLLLATTDDILDIIECERAQLQLEFSYDPHSPETCFIEQALEILKIRERELRYGITKEEAQPSIESKNEDLSLVRGELPDFQLDSEPPDTVFEESILSPEDDFQNQELLEIAPCQNPELKIDSETEVAIVKSWWEGEEVEEVEIVVPTNAVCSNNVQSPKVMENYVNDVQASSFAQKFFYFYQAANGQSVYLHAVNAKMLEMQYGSLDKCPRVITGKLLEKEDGSFTKELRQKMRYLGHLPLTSQFEIAEIELLSPLVSEDVRKAFKDQLEKRERKRQGKAREEKRRERKINEEENKRMGKFPTKKVHIESHRHFPQWNAEPQTGVSIPTPTESTATSSIASSPSLSTFDEVPAVEERLIWSANNNADSGPSFAQMLRQNASSNAWPAIKSRSNIRNEISPSGNEIDEDAESYVSMRSMNPTFGDALAQALEQSSLMEPTSEKPEETTTGGGKKKKKKNKPTVLFATGMARSP